MIDGIRVVTRQDFDNSFISEEAFTNNFLALSKIDLDIF